MATVPYIFASQTGIIPLQQLDDNFAAISSGSGTVTSVAVSGGTTGLTTSGGPITTSGTITLAGTLAIANGGTGQTTQQTAINALAGAVTSGQFLRGNGTNVVMAAIQASDVPTLNQNTTGTASNVTGTVAIANGGTGQTTKITAFDALSPLTTKGDLIGHDGTDNVRVGVGTNGFTLTANSSATTGVAWAQFSADIQEFTSTGTSTWTKPAGAKLVYVLMFGGGAGGGSGRRRATASSAIAAYGGGGGGSGGRTELWIPADALASTESVTVGAGGTGGAARTTDDTDGAAGGAGNDSLFGSWGRARGGGNGSGGTTTTGTAGTGGGGLAEVVFGTTTYSSSGGSGVNGTGSSGNRGGYRGGGGGGGGGFAAGSTSATGGGTGGAGGSLYGTTTLTTAGGGTGGAANASGSAGSNAASYFVGGDGGGAGGSSTTTAGAGAAGGYPGGGGGGGGAGHGVNSGAGGNGGNGYVRVVTFF